MGKFTLTFSIRDWKEGMYLLKDLGFLRETFASLDHELELDEEQKEELLDALREGDLEFELKAI